MCPLCFNFSDISQHLTKEKNVPIPEPFLRPSDFSASTHYVHVDLQAVSRNLKWIRGKIKGDLVVHLPRSAFGLGCRALYRHLATEGVTTIVVQTLVEAVELRENGWEQTVIVIEPMNGAMFEKMASHSLTTTVTAAAAVLGLKGVAVHIDVNADEEAERTRMGDIFQTCAGLQTPIECIYTVLDDNEGKTALKKQYERFIQIVGPYRWEGVKLLCISDVGMVYGVGTTLDLSGAGVLIYGYAYQRTTTRDGVVGYQVLESDLTPAVSWVAQPIHCNSFVRGARLDGSVHSPRAQGPRTRVVVIAVGKEDGLPAELDGLQVMDDERKSHVVFGPVTASYCQIKLSDDSSCPPSLIHLVSTAPAGETSMIALCHRTGRNADDLLSGISCRVPRIATEGARIASREQEDVIMMEMSEMSRWY